MLLSILFIIWVICSVINYSMLFAYTCGEFPTVAEDLYDENRSSSILFGIILGTFGPVGIFVTYLVTTFAKHGFKFK